MRLHLRGSASNPAIVATLVAMTACGGSRAPAFAPTTPAATADTSAVDAAYARMAVAAASHLKLLIGGKTAAMFQTESPSPTLRAVVGAVIEVYGYTELRQGEADYACAARVRGVPTPAMPNCRIDVAEVLLQLTSLQMNRDSGYVGGLMTEIKRGDTKPRTTPFCLVAARHGGDWIGVQHSNVESPRDCANDRKH